MKEANKIFYLTILITGFVVFFTTAGSIYFLYHTAVEEQKDRLLEVVKSTASLIHAFHEATSSHGKDMSLDTHKSHANELEDFFSLLTDSSSAGDKRSKKAVLNFFIAEQKNDYAYFYIGTQQLTRTPVPINNLAGKPMGLALKGLSDVMKTTDHLGNTILCSYTFVDSLGIGIVAKILLKDIRRPFFTTALTTYIGAFLLFVSSGLIMKLTVSPLASRLERKRQQLEEVNKNLHKLATTDHLTELYNRQYFNKQLEHFLLLADRHRHIISIIMFDIDNFKKINDSFGHPAGDSVLKELSLLLMREVRKTDIVARWGGEEFILLTIVAKKDDAHHLAKKLCDKISQHLFTINQQVTCSFGVTTYIPDENIDTLINRVDAALYDAKRKGRNTIVSR